MYFKFRLMLLLTLCSMQSIVQAELLVAKKGADGFLAPLDDQDCLKYGKIISETILKYQWPMCIASDLTAAEQDALLSSGVPNGEELFISNKLKELIPATDIELSVIFVPTSVYELFCIRETIQNKVQQQNNPFSDVVQKILSNQFNNPLNINLAPILYDGKNQNEAFKQIYQEYDKANRLFFDGQISAWLSVNNAFIRFLCNDHPTVLKGDLDPLTLSHLGIDKALAIASGLISYIILQSKKFHANMGEHLLGPIVKPLRKNNENHVLQKVVNLEYQARSSNKGLLLRGSSLEDFQVSGSRNDDNMQKLAGTTVRRRPNEKVEQIYREKKIIPYSISFGNSLFAGAFFDRGACAYCFLTNIHEDSLKPATGYALFVNKKDYLQTRNARLFFISALAPIASLFARGEWFHSRSTAASGLKIKDLLQPIVGIAMRHGIKDEAGVILVSRDPLFHAQLFSQFLAQNGQLIQKGDDSAMTQEEQQFAANILKAQKEAALFYDLVRLSGKTVDRSVKKYVQKHKAQAETRKTHEALPFPQGLENEPSKEVSTKAAAPVLLRKRFWDSGYYNRGKVKIPVAVPVTV
ncbi:MAG: hypothetical protein NTZ68_02790 [Candidatus Dependentiae bacterium]|nr:hypothetical protein [Candidatus Dependentiae bacterium]